MRRYQMMSSFLALLIGLSGCGTAGNELSGDTTEATGLSSETAAQGREAHTDNLPELNFGGADFRIWVTDRYKYEMDVEESSADVCKDSVYKRNISIEERFNVNIKTVVTDMDSSDNLNAQPKAIQASILAGDDSCDLAAIMVYRVGSLILDGCFLNWRDMKYVDYSQPWWPKEVNDTFTVDGKQYGAVSDLCITTLQLAYAMLFNKQLAEDNQIEDLYSVVDEGRWTIDYLNQLVTGIYQDVNGDTVRGEEDVYGFVGAKNATDSDAYLPAFNQPLITAGNDGSLNLAINCEKTVNALEKIINLYNKNSGSLAVPYWNRYDMFKQNQALIIPARIITLYDRLRDMDVDFGVLPYPKYDEEQEKYMGNSVDNFSVLCIPVTAPNPEMTAALVEAMSCESYRTVVPAFYDVALGSKFTRDERSIDMLDYIMEGRNYDLSILHNETIPKLSYLFRQCVANNEQNFASAYAAQEAAYKDGLKTVQDTYAALDGGRQ